MRTVREQYWRYSLFVLILTLGVVVFVELTPFLGGLLGAATIYVLLRGQMCHLTERRGWRRAAAAWLLLGESVLLFLVPISLIVWLVVDRVQHATLDPQTLLVPMKHLAELVHVKFGYDPWQQSNIHSFLAWLPDAGQWLLTRIVAFGINLVVLLFVLYFMLLGGHKMEDYFRDILPFNRSTTSRVMRDVHMIVRSNAIVIPLLAVVQGVVGLLGYVVFGVPNPLFWGVLTCFATIIPLVGTALVWFPLSVFMAMSGHWGAALGLTLFGGLVITHVDNVVRFVMQRRMADIHPLVTIFGVVIGLSLFGFMGVIFGPLLLSLLIFCVDLFKRKYLDCPSDPALATPAPASTSALASDLAPASTSALASDLAPASASALASDLAPASAPEPIPVSTPMSVVASDRAPSPPSTPSVPPSQETTE